ncbi:hypothetical protein FH063_003824 [Azospirillum argentinense]|uniref:Uncharacterized protein n=1 Tax=Azospirillum argentinense TaxID=2970906 RepID=A0A5B0KYD5_9PROT|nr:hypothetical protein FH063_003824 [Azospirillum argentinense]
MKYNTRKTYFSCSIDSWRDYHFLYKTLPMQSHEHSRTKAYNDMLFCKAN